MSWEDDYNKGYHTGDWTDYNRGLYEQDDRNRSSDNGYSGYDSGSSGGGSGDSGGGNYHYGHGGGGRGCGVPIPGGHSIGCGIIALIVIIFGIAYIVAMVSPPRNYKDGELPYVSQNIELNTEVKDWIQSLSNYSANHINTSIGVIPPEHNEYHFTVEKEGVLCFDAKPFIRAGAYEGEIYNEKTKEYDWISFYEAYGEPVKPGKYIIYIYRQPPLGMFGTIFKRPIKFTVRFYEGVPEEFKKGTNNVPEGTTNENYTIGYHEKSYPYVGETTKNE